MIWYTGQKRGTRMQTHWAVRFYQGEGTSHTFQEMCSCRRRWPDYQLRLRNWQKCQRRCHHVAWVRWFREHKRPKPTRGRVSAIQAQGHWITDTKRTLSMGITWCDTTSSPISIHGSRAFRTPRNCKPERLCGESQLVAKNLQNHWIICVAECTQRQQIRKPSLRDHWAIGAGHKQYGIQFPSTLLGRWKEKYSLSPTHTLRDCKYE